MTEIPMEMMTSVAIAQMYLMPSTLAEILGFNESLLHHAFEVSTGYLLHALENNPAVFADHVNDAMGAIATVRRKIIDGVQEKGLGVAEIAAALGAEVSVDCSGEDGRLSLEEIAEKAKGERPANVSPDAWAVIQTIAQHYEAKKAKETNNG